MINLFFSALIGSNKQILKTRSQEVNVFRSIGIPEQQFCQLLWPVLTYDVLIDDVLLTHVGTMNSTLSNLLLGLHQR